MAPKENIRIAEFRDDLVVQRLRLVVRRQIRLERSGPDAFQFRELRDEIVSFTLGRLGRVVDCDGAALLGEQPRRREADPASAMGLSARQLGLRMHARLACSL